MTVARVASSAVPRARVLKRTKSIRITRKGIGLPRGLRGVCSAVQMRYDSAGV
jgi:hypothetical protein